VHKGTSNISHEIKEFAKSKGASLIGFAPAEFDEIGGEHLKSFVQQGRQGSMSYLEDYEKRVDPQKLLPGAKSVIVIAVNYYREVPSTPEGHGSIARYAYGRDYHKVIKKLLQNIAQFIEEKEPEAKTKLCVDTAPLLEKSYAVKAGIGFIGKNTTLITPECGSYVLLGEILTDLRLEYDKPSEGTCGTCTRCLEGCPTKALTKPHEMDAKRCISYLTIEHKGPIPKQLQKPMGKRIFGCDICQEVCPYNKSLAKPGANKDFQKPIAGSSIRLKEILNMKTDEQFLDRFAGSPLMRTKRSGLQRNAKIARQNSRH